MTQYNYIAITGVGSCSELGVLYTYQSCYSSFDNKTDTRGPRDLCFFVYLVQAD